MSIHYFVSSSIDFGRGALEGLPGVIDADRWNAFYDFINKEGLAEAKIPENIGFSKDYLPAAK